VGGVIEDCVEDFQDIQFWSVMRDEDWWFEQSNQQYFDFYEFWQEYHFSDDDFEPECEWKEFNGQCSDFMMLDGECNIYVSYNPCVHDHFECQLMKQVQDYDMNEIAEVENCAEDFTQLSFWMAMREEQFWMDNQQYTDFFMFWEHYHMDHDDYDYDHHDDYDRECDDVEIEVDCNVFSFGEDDCRVVAEYNRCPEREHFICDMLTLDEYGNEQRDDCAEDFEDP
jgi:hypothetical protein